MKSYVTNVLITKCLFKLAGLNSKSKILLFESLHGFKNFHNLTFRIALNSKFGFG
jgi:hypothetical protein